MKTRETVMQDAHLHLGIIVLMEELGYPIKGTLGLCEGIALSGIHAFYNNKIEKYNDTIKFIENDLLRYFDLAKLKHRLINQDRTVVTEEDTKIIAALDFFDDIAWHQIKKSKSRLFTKADKRSIELLSAYNINSEGLFSKDLCNVGSIDDFTLLFKIIYSTIINNSDINISLKIDAGYKRLTGIGWDSHVIGICFNLEKKNLLFINSNQLPIKELQLNSVDEILDIIKYAFLNITDQKYSLIQTKILYSSDLLENIAKKIGSNTNQFVSPDSVIGLGIFQKLSLNELRQHGLTATHLRNWHGDQFLTAHKDALTHLILKRSFTPENAVAEICELTIRQAEAISDGFLRSDVIGLDYSQLTALKFLNNYGVTGVHLRKWHGPGNYFSVDHYIALEYLLSKCHLKPEDAITELNGLNQEEAYEITRQNRHNKAPIPPSVTQISIFQSEEQKNIMESMPVTRHKWLENT